MKRIAETIAVLALGLVAGSTVPSVAWPQPSSAYDVSFGFSPNDEQGFDQELRKWGTEAWRAAKASRAKWRQCRLIVEAGE